MNYRTICVECKHYGGDRTCAAFPDGVPDKILRSGWDHRNPWPGDHGIRFEPDGPVDVDWIEKVIAGPPRPRG